MIWGRSAKHRKAHASNQATRQRRARLAAAEARLLSEGSHATQASSRGGRASSPCPLGSPGARAASAGGQAHADVSERRSFLRKRRASSSRACDRASMTCSMYTFCGNEERSVPAAQGFALNRTTHLAIVGVVRELDGNLLALRPHSVRSHPATPDEATAGSQRGLPRRKA